MGNFIRLTLAPLVGVALVVYETVFGQRSPTVYGVCVALIGVPPFLGEVGFSKIVDAMRDATPKSNGKKPPNGAALMLAVAQ